MTMTAHSQVESAADLNTIVCGACGGIYAIAVRYVAQKQEEGGYWHCPYCKCSWGYGSSENSRLRLQLTIKEREVEQERKRKEWAQQEARITERRRRAIKGHFTKTKKRIAHGVCPCCNRSFGNLHRHMSTKHPNYSGDKK